MMSNLKLSKNIKIVVSDFDGVFTDGSVYIDENLKHTKRLSYKDIMGVSMLLKAGYDFAIISGEDSNILNYFNIKFGIEEIHKGIRNKGIVLEDLMARKNLTKEEVLYIGDDINDISAFELVQYKIAPKNANPIIKLRDDIQITNATGGDGAIREIVDTLLNNTEEPKEKETEILSYE